MHTVRLKTLKNNIVDTQDDLPFPTNWEEIKAEVLKWSVETTEVPLPIGVLEYLEERYYSPYKRNKPLSKERVRLT
jgi:hypothetical protein